jgi:hypothetical protein
VVGHGIGHDLIDRVDHGAGRGEATAALVGEVGGQGAAVIGHRGPGDEAGDLQSAKHDVHRLHASLDGRRVINYAQWAGAHHYQEALQRADVREHMSEAAALAQAWDPTLVRVRSIHHPQPDRA